MKRLIVVGTVVAICLVILLNVAFFIVASFLSTFDYGQYGIFRIMRMYVAVLCFLYVIAISVVGAKLIGCIQEQFSNLSSRQTVPTKFVIGLILASTVLLIRSAANLLFFVHLRWVPNRIAYLLLDFNVSMMLPNLIIYLATLRIAALEVKESRILTNSMSSSSFNF